jgi:hypothetical protein
MTQQMTPAAAATGTFNYRRRPKANRMGYGAIRITAPAEGCFGVNLIDDTDSFGPAVSEEHSSQKSSARIPRNLAIATKSFRIHAFCRAIQVGNPELLKCGNPRPRTSMRTAQRSGT